MEDRVDNEMYSMNVILNDTTYFSKYLSEGDSNLEYILKWLWDKNITTIACCRGHKSNDTSPYLFIATDNKVQFDYIISFVLKLINKNTSYNIRVNKNNKNNNYINIVIEEWDNKYTVFKDLKSILESEV